jgi:hypothetical protein
MCVYLQEWFIVEGIKDWFRELISIYRGAAEGKLRLIEETVFNFVLYLLVVLEV